MSYQERPITREILERFVSTLDSDEGIRIDNHNEKIFVNKSSKRYCIDISKDGNDEFVYKNTVQEVMSFLREKLVPESKIFSY